MLLYIQLSKGICQIVKMEKKMKIKDFLENFQSDESISIFDRTNGQTKIIHDKKQVIKLFGFYSVKTWNIINGHLFIAIQSQF